jgi:hypothetical protein
MRRALDMPLLKISKEGPSSKSPPNQMTITSLDDLNKQYLQQTAKKHN